MPEHNAPEGIKRVTVFSAPGGENAYHCSRGEYESGGYVYKEMADDLLAACQLYLRYNAENCQTGTITHDAVANAVKPWADDTDAPA